MNTYATMGGSFLEKITIPRTSYNRFMTLRVMAFLITFFAIRVISVSAYVGRVKEKIR